MAIWIQENALDLLGTLVPFLGILISARIVVWQLGRQHANSLRLQRKNAQEALKLQIYQTLDAASRKASESVSEAGMYAFEIPYHLETYYKTHGQAPLRHSAPEFNQLHSKAIMAVGDLMIEFESWSIAFPSLVVFNRAFNCASHDARETQVPLFATLLGVLPGGRPTTPSVQPQPIRAVHPKVLANLKMVTEKYKDAMDTIQDYLGDLVNEGQNRLLSDLFDGATVPQRQPLDPGHKVISTDPEAAKELIRYFEEETAWGKRTAETEREVRVGLDDATTE